jgi:hypothetical protein
MLSKDAVAWQGPDANTEQDCGYPCQCAFSRDPARADPIERPSGRREFVGLSQVYDQLE